MAAKKRKPAIGNVARPEGWVDDAAEGLFRAGTKIANSGRGTVRRQKVGNKVSRGALRLSPRVRRDAKNIADKPFSGISRRDFYDMIEPKRGTSSYPFAAPRPRTVKPPRKQAKYMTRGEKETYDLNARGIELRMGRNYYGDAAKVDAKIARRGKKMVKRSMRGMR